jgi:hypothetical protein
MDGKPATMLSCAAAEARATQRAHLSAYLSRRLQL